MKRLTIFGAVAGLSVVVLLGTALVCALIWPVIAGMLKFSGIASGWDQAYSWSSYAIGALWLSIALDVLFFGSLGLIGCAFLDDSDEIPSSRNK